LLGGEHGLPHLRLGEVLMEDRLISNEQIQEALLRQNKARRSKHTGQILVDMQLSTREELNVVLAKKLGISYMHLKGFGLPEQILPRIPADVAIRYSDVPLSEYNGKLVVAV
jgi:hypothetical protein